MWLIDHLKGEVDRGVVSCLGPYQSALAELERLDLAEAEGARIRARIRWIEEGEASTAFFFRKEHKQSADHWVPALWDPEGAVHCDVEGIGTVLSDFYTFLFLEEPCDPVAGDELLSNVSSALPPRQASLCEGPLSLEECFTALKEMARRKAPGVDGLPMEFHLKFWDVLGPELVEVLNCCWGRGYLAKSQRRGVISLNFKKEYGLDPHNWCLISLLCVDYKIASRAITGCLLKVIHLIVNECQTCGVPGRFIGDSVVFL